MADKNEGSPINRRANQKGGRGAPPTAKAVGFRAEYFYEA